MSYGVVGLNHPGIRVIRDAQKFREIYVHDKNATNLVCFKHVKVQPSVADMTLNMNGPRTIATFMRNHEESKRTMHQLIEWCDEEDTILNLSNEHYGESELYSSMCKENDIHYMTAGISNDTLMVGGKKEIFDAHEIFFRTFARDIVHISEDAGSGHFTKMIHENMECALFQAYADTLSYCNQEKTITYILDEAKNTDINGPLLKTSINRLFSSHQYEDIAHINNNSIWCSKYALDKCIPTPVLQTSMNARMTSRYMKMMETKQPFNRFFDRDVALNTLRFMYAMVYYEGTQLSPHINKCIHGSALDCRIFSSDPFDIMNDTIKYARTFVMHCAHAGIPCPIVQAAVCQYDFLYQTKTSMNFIASLRI